MEGVYIIPEDPEIANGNDIEIEPNGHLHREDERAEAIDEAELQDPFMWPSINRIPLDDIVDYIYNPTKAQEEREDDNETERANRARRTETGWVATATTDAHDDIFVMDWRIRKVSRVLQQEGAGLELDLELSKLHPEIGPMFFSPCTIDPKYNNSWKLGLQFVGSARNDNDVVEDEDHNAGAHPDDDFRFDFDQNHPDPANGPGSICIYLEGELNKDEEHPYFGIVYFGFGDRNGRFEHPDFRLRYPFEMTENFQNVESDPTKVKVLVPLWEIHGLELAEYSMPDNTLRMRAIIHYNKKNMDKVVFADGPYPTKKDIEDRQSENIAKHCGLMLKLLLENEGDVTVLTQGSEMHVHRLILEGRKVYELLEFMVKSKSTEIRPSFDNENEAITIDLSEFPKPVVRGLMEFIYSAEIIEQHNIRLLKKVFYLARKIGYENCMEYIGDILINLVTDYSCGKLYVFAVKNFLEDLKVASGTHIRNFAWKLETNVKFRKYIEKYRHIFEDGQEYFGFLEMFHPVGDA